MATNNKTANVTEEEKVPQENPKAKAKEEEKVPLLIPLGGDGEDPEWTGGVNGKMYKIKKGEPVMVPKSLYKVYQNSELQEVTARKNRERFKEVEL